VFAGDYARMTEDLAAQLDTLEFLVDSSIVMPRATLLVPIDRPAQVRALASPLRQELLDLLVAAGPCSIAELAERLGRAPDSLYFHVRRLLQVGLVVERERRQVGRHVFVVYDAAGRPMRIERSKARRADIQAVVAGIQRLALRDWKRALGDPAARGDGARRNHAAARVRGWLDPRELERVNELLEELGELLGAGRPGPGRQPVALAWVLAPLPPRRGVRAATVTRNRTKNRTAPRAARSRNGPRRH
jgi:DNA-binding transcriptional ArsR family regulator